MFHELKDKLGHEHHVNLAVAADVVFFKDGSAIVHLPSGDVHCDGEEAMCLRGKVLQLGQTAQRSAEIIQGLASLGEPPVLRAPEGVRPGEVPAGCPQPLAARVVESTAELNDAIGY